MDLSTWGQDLQSKLRFSLRGQHNAHGSGWDNLASLEEGLYVLGETLEQLNSISATGSCKWCSVPIWLASFKYKHGAKMPVKVYSKAWGVKIMAIPDQIGRASC